MEIDWGWPIALQALWLLPLLALYGGWRFKRRRHLLARLAEQPSLDTLIPRLDPRADWIRLVLLLSALTAGILALAQPRWGFEWRNVQKRGLDIVIALDTSRSMLVRDLPGNRLEASKRGIQDFLGLLKGDRVGLVAFSGASFRQCPLTSDYKTFQLALGDVDTGIIQQGGTDIGGAVRTCSEVFEDEVEADRVIILITDGEDHEDRIGGLIDELKEKNVRLYAVGVGTEGGKPIELMTDSGETEYLKDEKGNIVTSALVETPLRSLSTATGGFYVRSFSQGDFGLETIFNKGIDRLQRNSNDESRIKVMYERFGWFIGGALLLLFFEGLVGRRRRN